MVREPLQDLPPLLVEGAAAVRLDAEHAQDPLRALERQDDLRERPSGAARGRRAGLASDLRLPGARGDLGEALARAPIPVRCEALLQTRPGAVHEPDTLGRQGRDARLRVAERPAERLDRLLQDRADVAQPADRLL